MSELTLLILRIGFLLVLWIFIFAIVYALRSDLFGAPVRRMKGDGSASVQAVTPAARPAAPAAPAAPQAATGPPAITPSGGALPTAGGLGAPKHLVITSGVASGTSIVLDDDLVTIGRSSDSTLVIVDEYTSTYHARLARTGGEWILTDLDSTNGTRLDGARVTKSVPVPPYTPVTIGTTTFELRP
ncbi:FHA domain-containing protein FhaB/FipA [Leucobacter chromiiresistens]|uniref:FHA domain-containing protein n=1 Tax=Leucobacter chromiiresistens TaxID=1079994 RepID=A0A1H0Y9M9_9MICO|nr:FHA domain-containing protein [Leucobacter chromiiresistens]SDQ11792.1 FHA domain-containing protein [Leucobacter chromiiresistens]